jgi:hypothetical protein
MKHFNGLLQLKNLTIQQLNHLTIYQFTNLSI